MHVVVSSLERLDELYWVTIPARNLFTWCFFMYIDSKQGLEKRLSFSGERVGSISTFHRNLLDRKGEEKMELMYILVWLNSLTTKLISTFFFFLRCCCCILCVNDAGRDSLGNMVREALSCGSSGTRFLRGWVVSYMTKNLSIYC